MMPVSPAPPSLVTTNPPVMPALVSPLQRGLQVGIQTEDQPAERLQKEHPKEHPKERPPPRKTTLLQRRPFRQMTVPQLTVDA